MSFLVRPGLTGTLHQNADEHHDGAEAGHQRSCDQHLTALIGILGCLALRPTFTEVHVRILERHAGQARYDKKTGKGCGDARANAFAYICRNTR